MVCGEEKNTINANKLPTLLTLFIMLRMLTLSQWHICIFASLPPFSKETIVSEGNIWILLSLLIYIWGLVE